jgi:probable phosphoglycerate mutase
MGSAPPDGVRRLLLVRHGVTEWNREGRFQGHLDPPLAASGREQARLLGARLRAVAPRPMRIVTSTLGRASQTAELIAAELAAVDGRIELQSDARLMEIGQGDWEGRTHADLALNDPVRYEAWRTSDREPPNGEPVADAQQRVDALLAELLPVAPQTALCLVSHGGTLRLVARSIFGWSIERTWQTDLDNASLSWLDETDDGGWRLGRWNDVHHLLGRLTTHVDEADGAPLAL